MNTSIHYLYRDGNNYKRGHTIVIPGELKFSQLKPFLDDGLYFCPQDVGLPHPGDQFRDAGFDYPTDSDHAWVELREEDIGPVRAPVTVEIDADELVRKFCEACEAGWPAGNGSACR